MEIDKLIETCEKDCKHLFDKAEKIALFNQQKVLTAFANNRIAPRHFEPSSGYAYDDQGRAALCAVFRDTFAAEDALVSPLFMSGTHTISTALLGLMRPAEVCLSVTGTPYDTLNKVINGQGTGSLKDFGIDFHCCPLTKDGEFDYPQIQKDIITKKPNYIYLQRSKGYNWRRSFGISDIKQLTDFVRELTDAPILVDNCYGEFVEETEPTQAGADLIMGSLIKNPGGGFAPTGGYIAGKSALLKKIEGRYSAPGVGFEIGACPHGYKSYFQGLFMSPHTVLQAVKSYVLFGEVFSALGYEVLGDGNGFDIVRAIKLQSEQQLLAFIRAVQAASPIDSNVVPYAWDMPGYKDKVVMAAGTFIQGASIELSADAPMRSPYIAFVQGALTYEHAKIACISCAKAVQNS